MEKHIGPIQIELTSVITDDLDAVLTYKQRVAIFEIMRTTNVLSGRQKGSKVVATTGFTLDLAVVGIFPVATVIKH